MKKFWWSLGYAAVLGFLSNFARLLLPDRLDPEAFPFRSFDFEENGKFYERFGIRRWKNKVPDMSKYWKRLPRKKMTPGDGADKTGILIQETCVAELVHWGLILFSLGIFLFWRTPGAVCFFFLYNLLGNVPFIMIQRYNRPRLLKLAAKQPGGRRSLGAV